MLAIPYIHVGQLRVNGNCKEKEGNSNIYIFVDKSQRHDLQEP
jgi:hypothetical protein